jgi:hypothetical protein
MIEVACCVCGGSLHTDTDYVELTATWVPPEQREQTYYAHTGCMSDLNDPEEFGGGSDGAGGAGGGPPMYDP